MQKMISMSSRILELVKIPKINYSKMSSLRKLNLFDFFIIQEEIHFFTTKLALVIMSFFEEGNIELSVH